MERIRPAHLARAKDLDAQIIVSLGAKLGGPRTTYDYQFLSRQSLEAAHEGTVVVSRLNAPRRRTSEPFPCPVLGCDIPTLGKVVDHALDRFAASDFDKD